MTQTTAFSGYTRRATETESKELIHDSYVMYIHTNICSRCGCGERYHELFEVWVHPVKTRTTGLRQQRRLMTTQLQDKHISYIELPDQSVPICSDCVSTYKSSTDKTPTAEPSLSAWADTLKRKAADAAKPAEKIARTSAPAKRIPTLDEL